MTKYNSLELSKWAHKDNYQVMREIKKSNLYKYTETTYLVDGGIRSVLVLDKESYELYLENNRPNVYVIQAGNYCKVGTTNDIERVLDYIKMYNPHNPVLLYFGKKVDIYNTIHTKYCKIRTQCDWFKLSDEELTDLIINQQIL